MSIDSSRIAARGICASLRRALKMVRDGRASFAVTYLTAAYFELGNRGPYLAAEMVGSRSRFARLSLQCARVECAVREALMDLEYGAKLPGSWLPMADVAGGRP